MWADDPASPDDVAGGNSGMANLFAGADVEVEAVDSATLGGSISAAEEAVGRALRDSGLPRDR